MLIVLIVLKVLASWTAISAVVSFAIAPALSRRIRNINFPQEMNRSPARECNERDPGP